MEEFDQHIKLEKVNEQKSKTNKDKSEAKFDSNSICLNEFELEFLGKRSDKIKRDVSQSDYQFKEKESNIKNKKTKKTEKKDKYILDRSNHFFDKKYLNSTKKKNEKVQLNKSDFTQNIDDESWTPSEDMALLRNVKQLGRKWQKIGSLINKKSSICQLRYYKLTKKEKIKPWSFDEDYLLILGSHAFDKRWKELERYFNGRNSITLKQRYHYTIKSKKFKSLIIKKIKEIDNSLDNFKMIDLVTPDQREIYFMNMILIKKFWKFSQGKISIFANLVAQHKFVGKDISPRLFNLEIEKKLGDNLRLE